jgi:hypothetical protein
MEVSGQIYATAASPPAKELLYPLDRRLVGPQSRSGRGWEEISEPAMNRIPVVQPVAWSL